MNRLLDVVACFWVLLIIVAFWGPYLGLALPPNIATALYAVFFLLATVRLTLSLLRQKPE